MNQERFDIEFEGSRILEDVQIDGSLNTDKSVCLDGKIWGDVSARKCVVINRNALIEGNVNCEELYINGKVTGDVCVVRKTVMGADAVIEGALITDTLEITSGATIGKGLKLKKASK